MQEVIRRPVGRGVLELAEGDITALEVDAVVNAANSALQLGAGVAGAIRRRGGPSIQEECDRIGGCPVGGAVATGAGDLPARWVIHAVGPVWGNHPPEESDRLLASAAREALARAAELEAASVALPSLSTGIFGFPVDRAARLLLREGIAHLEADPSGRRVVFCLFDRATFEAYRRALDEAFPA
jgi:O-acetyl-ADP-ribose deacetylase